MVSFKGYEDAFKKSEVAGMGRLYYDHIKPFIKEVKYFNVFKPLRVVETQMGYIIPQGWVAVIELLKLNKVQLQQLVKDITMQVEAYHIDEYKS